MTEKRFIIDEEKIKNNHINYIQVLQNLLSNEGLELTKIDALKYDIEKIKKSFDELHKNYIDLLEQQGELEEENKELKEELLIYRKIASCSNCKYQNYDWFDDGDEFEICERGNNEQQIEYHICEDWREL